LKLYYEHAGITIYHGDAREIFPSLDCDVVLADPPYGISHPTDYAKRGRGKLANCSDYAPVFEDDVPFDPSYLLRGAQVILWGANYFADKLPPASGWLIWDKERPHELDQATAELAWTNCVKGARVFRHMWNGMLRASEPETAVHPTQKPIALMKWCLTLRWIKEGVVCDPYMGSGPTLIAAKDLGRKAIGIEIEEKYCEIAAKRLSQEVMQFRAPAGMEEGTCEK
jgi:site-specific DNA-methyltransferase (adenine-specific)